jgi:hypothetical protein
MKFNLLFFILLFSFYLKAQDLRLKKFPLIKNNDTLIHAWAGGLNTPQFSEIDLNNDGIRDLLVYDRSSQAIQTYLNRGTVGMVDYIFAPEYISCFPQNVRNFMLARDYNCDGIEDLFFYNQPPFTSGGVAVMRGSYDSNNKITFTPQSPILQYNSVFGLGDIFIYNPDIPGIEDIDFDGDMDIVAFTLDFSFIRNMWFYKNKSVERGLGCDSLIFDLEHECFGMATETPFNNNTYYLSPGIDSCADNNYWNRFSATPRHTGSSVTLVDWNNDQSMDVLVGDVSIKTLNMLTSSIVNDTFLIISQDSIYPNYDMPVQVFSYPSSYFLDVDNDNDKDLLVCPTELAIGEAVTDSVVWYYQNNHQDSILVDFVQKDFLVGEMIDLGMNSNAAIVDVNGDGLLDIVAGHFAYTDSFQTYRSALTYIQNVGSLTQPSFSIQNTDFAGLSALNKRGLFPNFGDIDNDGDKDMIVGDMDGTLNLFINTAGAGNSFIFATPQTNYKSIDVGNFSTPQLVDIDRDGDLDLMIGNYQGRLFYFQNTGTPSSADFSATPTSNTFGFDLTSFGSRVSAPHFYDNNGAFELFLGHEAGSIIHLGGIDGNITGIYDTLNLNLGNIFLGRNTTVAVADFNADDTLDYVIGNIRGGLGIYSTSFNEQVLVSDTKTVNKDFEVLIFPNPVKDVFTVSTDNNMNLCKIEIFDINGRLIKSILPNNTKNIIQIDISECPSSVYFVRTKIDNGLIRMKKIIKY